MASLVSLLAINMALVFLPQTITAAPISLHATEMETISVQQLQRNLHRGVTATVLYASMINQHQPSVTTSAQDEDTHSQQFQSNFTTGLCQLLATYDLLEKVNLSTTAELRLLMRENLMDGCQLMKKINSTSEGVNITLHESGETVTVTLNLPWVEEEQSTCDPDHSSFLHHYCAREGNVNEAANNILRSFATDQGDGGNYCQWLNSTLSEPHLSTVYSEVC